MCEAQLSEQKLFGTLRNDAVDPISMLESKGVGRLTQIDSVGREKIEKTIPSSYWCRYLEQTLLYTRLCAEHRVPTA